MKNFVINLNRQPEKYAHFLELNAGSRIAFERHEACDGAALSDEQVAAMKIAMPGLKFTRGSIGCAASHQGLWRQTVETNEPILVFEDDAAIRNDFSEVYPRLLASLESWDYLTFGYNTDSILDIEWARGMTSAVAFAPAPLRSSTMIFFAPSAAKRSHKPLPMPSAPPVTTTILPLTFMLPPGRACGEIVAGAAWAARPARPRRCL